MKYPEGTKYKLVCPYCGSRAFHYAEARVFNVKIDMLDIEEGTDIWDRKCYYLNPHLGRDMHRQFGGDPDTLYDWGHVVCSKCNTAIGTGYQNRTVYKESVYEVSKGFPRTRQFAGKEKYNPTRKRNSNQ
jgi:hypothetical protein